MSEPDSSSGPAPEPLSRRERRKLEMRARILDAARTHFEENGVEATTVASICDTADIAHKTFFNHFPSKRDLLREFASLSVENLLENLEQTRKQPGSTRERILFFFELVATNCESAGRTSRDLITEVVHAAHEFQTEHEQARKLHDAFGAIVRDGLENGDITLDHDPGTLTDMLMGGFYALMFNWANLEHYPVREHALANARFLGEAMSARD